MPRLNSKTIDLTTLESRGDEAITVIKLAMAFNDLSIADLSLVNWKRAMSPLWKEKQKAAQYYFIRLQISHLFEAIRILAEIEENPNLVKVLDRCDVKTKASYNFLKDFLPRRSKRSDFEELVGRIRHSVTFHYQNDGKLIKKALNDRASREEARNSRISRSDESMGWHFDFATEIVDSIVVREIWKIPRDADLREEADKKADFVHEIFRNFLEFSSDFIWTYFEK